MHAIAFDRICCKPISRPVCTTSCSKQIYILIILKPQILRLHWHSFPDRNLYLLFVKRSQQIHNKMPMLSSEETKLMTARILWRNVTTQHKIVCGLVPVSSLIKDLWSISGANPNDGSVQTTVVVAVRAQKDTICKVYSSVISTVGERHWSWDQWLFWRLKTIVRWKMNCGEGNHIWNIDSDYN